MIDQGVDGICILANYSEQFLLTDAERDALLEVCLKHVAGRTGDRAVQPLQHPHARSGPRAGRALPLVPCAYR